MTAMNAQKAKPSFLEFVFRATLGDQLIVFKPINVMEIDSCLTWLKRVYLCNAIFPDVSMRPAPTRIYHHRRTRLLLFQLEI